MGTGAVKQLIKGQMSAMSYILQCCPYIYIYKYTIYSLSLDVGCAFPLAKRKRLRRRLRVRLQLYRFKRSDLISLADFLKSMPPFALPSCLVSWIELRALSTESGCDPKLLEPCALATSIRVGRVCHRKRSVANWQVHMAILRYGSIRIQNLTIIIVLIIFYSEFY